MVSRPIFKPGDIQFWATVDLVTGKPTITEQVNAKLASLGIDSDTPERLKWLEDRLAQVYGRLQALGIDKELLK